MQGLEDSRSPRRSPPGDSGIEIIPGAPESPPGTQELRVVSPPANPGVVLEISTGNTTGDGGITVGAQGSSQSSPGRKREARHRNLGTLGNVGWGVTRDAGV